MTPTICPFCNIKHATSVPTVHLNGTNGQDLFEQLHGAAEAVRLAQQMMERAGPNGRDYYPQGDFALAQAIHSHERRWADLNRVLAELTEQRDHVQAVLDFQAARR